MIMEPARVESCELLSSCAGMEVAICDDPMMIMAANAIRILFAESADPELATAVPDFFTERKDIAPAIISNPDAPAKVSFSPKKMILQAYGKTNANCGMVNANALPPCFRLYIATA